MKNKFLTVTLVSIALATSLMTSCLDKSETKNKTEKSCRADQLFADNWKWSMERFPTYASSMNYGERHNTFFESTVENITKVNEEQKAYLKQAQDLISANDCTGRDLENLKLFKHKLEESVDAFKFKEYLVEFQSMGGPHTWMPQLYKRVPLKTVQNYEDYLERLGKLPDVFDRAKKMSLLGLKEGITPPKATFIDYESSMLDFSKGSAEESPYFQAFKTFPDTFTEEQKTKISDKAKKVITEKLQPAYKELHTFWVKEYYPNLRETISASSLPNGEDFYNFQVKKYTTLDYTASEVHEIGKKEVARILSEMEFIKDKVKFKGDLQAFFKHLRTSPQFYAKTKEELYMKTTHILKEMDGKMPKLFRTLARLTYGVEPIPDFIAHKSPAAYYQHGNMELGQSGTYQINLSNLDSRPLYNLEALSLHEAVPGHHHQIAIAQEIEGFPKFRKHMSVTAFIEGWGLYAESLGKLVGMYQDPYSDFGRLTYEQWRAMRLVVDTGIHSMGWSRKKAIDYMSANSGLSIKNITTEVDRYINWPGQALAYKMGELKLQELRKLSQEKLGDKYDIRDFHDVVLGSGALPLKILEEKVNNYINETLSSKTKKES